MCGISGIVATNVNRYADAQQRMIQSMHHRGPDGNGSYMFDNCSLGHNRLSIVDLASGDQPMLNSSKNTGIAFNGEIYGYKDIRDNLSYTYRTTSDTEVILALYEKYGTGLLTRLPGMFAFGIWDEDKQQFFAARDRFGEKPFFYAVAGDGTLVFASEIKAICASGIIRPEIDMAAVSKYLTYGYTGPVKTIYKNIYSLPPAHSLVYHKGKYEISRYWNFPVTSNEHISLSDAADKFENLFENAVRKQMVADVEVCAFLSGGLDSTSVVKIASQENRSLKTLAFGYKNKWSELPYARAAADMYRTDHHELLEEDIDIEELFLKLPDIYDEPFSDSSAVATYLICKAASKYGKVVLTGDGGDELLGGYTWWYRPLLQTIAARDTSPVNAGLVFAMAVGEKLQEKVSGNRLNRKWRDRHLSIKGSAQHKTVTAAAASRNNSNAIFSKLGLPSLPDFNPYWVEDNTINDALKYDIAEYMPGDILVKTDRAAMYSSLELRAPFLDVELAEFCISMPGKFKIDSKSDKILLREAMSKYWPEQIKNRGKQGFGVSGKHWSDSEKLKKLYDEYVYSSGSKLYTILPYTETKQIIKSHPSLVFSLLILAVWVEKYYS